MTEMTVHQSINIRAHLAKRHLILPKKLSKQDAMFWAYSTTGRSANALSKSPFQLSRKKVGA